MRDVRYALRLLRRDPGYAAVAVLTMAIGIGATTTLFSVAYGVLLKPLPWPDANRLMRATETRRGQQARVPGTLSNGSYRAWRDAATLTEAVGAYGLGTATVTVQRDAGEPVRVAVSRLSAEMFDVLRVRPIRGRAFLPSDEPDGGTSQAPAPQVAIVSYGVWQDWFGGRDDAVGRVLRIDDLPVTIVGVMPRDFSFPDRDARAWLPFPIGGVVGQNGVLRMMIFGAMARLKPGVTPQQASAEATALARTAPDPGLAAVGLFGSSAPPDIQLDAAAAAMTADVRPAILLLLAAVALLLLTATANVGALQVTRATVRRRELAIRSAIGAAPADLRRQMLVESLVLGGAGAVAGLLFTLALLRAVPAALPADFPRIDDIGINAPVALFMALVSMAASLACGVLPALDTSRVDVAHALVEESAASAGGVWGSSSARLRSLTMGAQVAVASVLLVGAGLLGRSFVALMHADRGFDPRNVLSARVDLPRRYSPQDRVAFFDTVVARLNGAPGVVAASAGNALPFLSQGGVAAFKMPSPTDPSINVSVQATTRVVGPGYLRAMGLRLVAGRWLDDTDALSTRPVMVVNRSFAKRYLGDRPIGARVPMSFGEGRPDADVVGIVDDMRQASVSDAPTPELFVSYRQLPVRLTSFPAVFVVRTADDPAAHVQALRTAVREQAADVPVDAIMTMEERLATSLAKPRLYAMLLTGFAIAALTIAGVGLFGVLSYSVAQRAREIGVRTALGAQVHDIVALVLRQALGISVAGIAVGLWSAYVLTRYLASFLYGVTRGDVVSYAVVAVAVSAVVMVACIVPARRAARVDPIEVLRSV